MYRERKYKSILLFTLLVLIFFAFPGMVQAAGEEATINYGAWSLVPPLLAILLCVILREALISLLLAIWVGATIINYGNFWTGITKAASNMVSQVADPWNASIILFYFVVGGLMGMIFFSGGGHAFLESISKKVKNSRMTQISAWLGGMVIFLDDYANTTFVGNLFRPLSDRYHVSREKFAYIVDSTSAPVASIFLISTWVGYQVGIIGNALPESITVSPYSLWLHSIPYSFYSIFAIVMVGLIAYTGRDFGPMLKAEYRARTTNELWAKGSRPLSGTSELKVAKNAPQRAINLWLPMIVLIGLAFYFMWQTGGGSEAESFTAAISDADAMISILWATVIAFVLAMVMYLSQRIAGIIEIMDSFMDGAKMMIYAILIMISAWSIGSICSELGTAPYIVSVLEGVMSPVALPLLTFIISAFIAFCTGTSWGTMAIVTPIVIPLAVSIDASLPVAISAVLTGAVMGDHCSPISDTTVMSSTFAGSDHIDHIKTQIPYVLTIVVVAVICYILVGIGIPVIIDLIIGVALLYLILRVLSASSARTLGITFPLPEWKPKNIKD